MNQNEYQIIIAKAKQNLRRTVTGLISTYLIFLIYCFASKSESALEFTIELSGMMALTIFALLFQYSNFKKILQDLES